MLRKMPPSWPDFAAVQRFRTAPAWCRRADLAPAGGEQDETRLITGVDANSALIVREILKRLRG